MSARTPHELMSCQEVRNLFLLGEVQVVSARERKESGGGFCRKDYPEKNVEVLRDEWMVCPFGRTTFELRQSTTIY